MPSAQQKFVQIILNFADGNVSGSWTSQLNYFVELAIFQEIFNLWYFIYFQVKTKAKSQKQVSLCCFDKIKN